MNPLVVDFLTRVGCHLCEEARPEVERAARKLGVTVRTVDIDRDDHLVAVYGLRIPVLLAPDGHVIAEGSLGTQSELGRAFRNWVKTQPRRGWSLRRS